MKLAQKTYSNLISRWLGHSPTVSEETAPLQLMALEDRVLYSAGPVPVEAVSAGADLLSQGDLLPQGDLQNFSASDLGLPAVEVDVTNTIEFLQAQIDFANSIDSIVDIQAIDNGTLDGDLGDSDALGLVDAAQVAAVQETATGLVLVDEPLSAGVSNGVSISGRVLHDVDGDGSVDENQILSGVEVTLFLDAGRGDGTLSQTDFAMAGSLTTTTDANGFYEFTDLRADETYFVVVNSLTLGEHLELNGLLNAGSVAENVRGVQTYASEGALFDRGAGQKVHSGGAFYGGYDIEQSDSPNVVNNFQHIIRHSSLTVDATDVDFGFSFNVVTNTRDGDFQSNSVNSNQPVQGSLRQFILNANAIAGSNELRFVPVVDASETLSTGDVWRIDIESSLPTITDAGTSINGVGYQTDGSLIAREQFQVSLGGGSLGFGVVDANLGPDFYPLLELSASGGASLNAGLVGLADQFEVSNLALVNFRTGIAVVGEDVQDAAIFDNLIGVRADGTQSATLQTIGVAVVGADNGRIEGNYIVDSRINGISIDGVLDTSDQAENWIIGSNYVFNRDDFSAASFSDGISLTGGTEGATVINNRIENSTEFGIDLWNNRGAVTIQGNTIIGAGSVRSADGTEVGGGIGLASAGNVIQGNEILNTAGTGILARGTAQFGITDIISATGNLISQNYFEANTGLDIDITRPQDLPLGSGALEIAAGDGLDAIDGVLDAGTGNNGIDRPEISFVGLQNGVLVVEGSLLNLVDDPKIELYLLGPNDSKLYFDTISVADQTSYDPVTGDFSAELVEPTEGWPSELTLGADVAAIVIDGTTSDTSEFSLAKEVELVNQPADFDTDESVFSIDENTTFVVDFESTDPEGISIEYSIVGGPDEELFTIGESLGQLSFVAAPDFENPNQVGEFDNIYEIIVRVEDDQGVGTNRSLTITVTDVPEFVETEFTQQENSTVTHQLNATAPDGSEFTFELELNDGIISLNQRGEFRFTEAPDFENPTDGDNVHTFTVEATSASGFFVTQEINLTVTDVNEPAEIENDFTLPSDDTNTLDEELDDAENENGTEDSTFDGTSLNPAMDENEEEVELGRVRPVPAPIELGLGQQAVVVASDSQLLDATTDLLLDYEANVYSRTAFFDLSNQELSTISSVGTTQSKADFSQHLKLSQFIVGTKDQSTSALPGISNLNLGDLTQPILGAGAMIGVAIAAAATVTSSQIPRVLDVGLLLDNEESIEEIVSS